MPLSTKGVGRFPEGIAPQPPIVENVRPSGGMGITKQSTVIYSVLSGLSHGEQV